jgi:hypothetical protein
MFMKGLDRSKTIINVKTDEGKISYEIISNSGIFVGTSLPPNLDLVQIKTEIGLKLPYKLHDLDRNSKFSILI